MITKEFAINLIRDQRTFENEIENIDVISKCLALIIKGDYNFSKDKYRLIDQQANI